VYPQNNLNYCGNLLHMLFAVPCEPYQVDPIAAEALDLLFILHADHEQNASTSTVRLAGKHRRESLCGHLGRSFGAVGSCARRRQRGRSSPCSSRSARWDNIPKVPGDGQGQVQPLPSHGLSVTRVYKNFDPRAKIIREMCHKVLAKLGAH